MHNAMLNKSKTSFETILSIDTMNFDDPNAENHAAANDTLGYHIVQDASESDDSVGFEYEEDNEGIMIVSPKNSVDHSRDNDLSVPDSVPSDLNSISDLPNQVLIPNLLGGTPGSDEEDEDLLIGFQERDPFVAAPTPVAASVRGCLSVWQFLGMVAVACVLGSAYMAHEHERNELQKQARYLKELEEDYLKNIEAINMAKEQEEKNRQLEEQVRMLQDEAIAREKVQAAKEAYWRSQSSAGSSFPFEDEPPLLDNCWVHARAKMEFGDCTKDVTKTVKEHVSSWGKSIDKARARVWKQMQQEFRDAKTWYSEQQQRERPREAAAAREIKASVLSWSNTVGKAPERIWTKLQQDYQEMMAWYGDQMPREGEATPPRKTSGSKPSATSSSTKNTSPTAMPKSGGVLKPTTKSFVVSMAMGTAAAVVLSAVDWFVKKQDDKE